MAQTLTHQASIVADPTIGFRRRVSAIAMPLAFVFQMICNATYAVVSQTSGMRDETGAETLAMYGRFPNELILATMTALIGCFLIVLGMPAALRVLRPVAARLGMWAVALMVSGYMVYFAIVFSNFDTLALAQGGVDAAAALDAAMESPWSTPFFLLFVIGNLIGTLLLGIAVILAARRADIGVPWWAGLLIVGWTVGHVTNLIAGNEWFAVAGGALEVIGLALVARAAFRMPDDVWASRG